MLRIRIPVLTEITTILKSRQALFGTAVFTIGSFVSSILNYILQAYSGRALTIEEYGIFNSFLSLSYLLSIPANVTALSTIRQVALLRVEKDYKTITKLFFGLLVLTLITGILMGLLLAVFKNPLLEYLNVSNSSNILVYLFGGFISFGLAIVVPLSFLQGLLRYKGFAITVILTSFVRTILAVSLVFLGFGVAGIFGALAIASVVGIIIGYFVLKKNLTSISDTDHLKSQLATIMTFSIAVLFMRLGMNGLNNIDIILVKHLFSPQDAGLYSGTVNLGKLILFGTGIIGSALFPIITNAYHSKKNYFLYFFAFFGVQVLAVMLSVLVFSLFPNILTLVLFGEQLMGSATYLPLFSVFIGIYVLVNVSTMFLLAIERGNVWSLLLIAGFFQYVLIHKYHQNLYQIIWVNISVVSVTLLLLLCYIIYLWRRYHVGFNNSTGIQTRENN